METHTSTIWRTPTEASAEAIATLRTTRAHAAACTSCSLHELRTNCVFGTGHANAELMWVGEAAGPEEDKTGEPFTGKSGELLDRINEAIGGTRRDTWLTNVVNCRLDEYRHLSKTQIDACREHLEAQISAVNPKVMNRPGVDSLELVQPGRQTPDGRDTGTSPPLAPEDGGTDLPPRVPAPQAGTQKGCLERCTSRAASAEQQTRRPRLQRGRHRTRGRSAVRVNTEEDRARGSLTHS